MARAVPCAASGDSLTLVFASTTSAKRNWNEVYGHKREQHQVQSDGGTPVDPQAIDSDDELLITRETTSGFFKTLQLGAQKSTCLQTIRPEERHSDQPT